MPDSNPTIDFSIIVPMFNGKGFLGEFFACLQSQTHKNWECIFVDDGSTDGSAVSLRELCEGSDQYKLIQKQPEGHPGLARNRGIAEARGRYLAFWDCDDLYHSETLACHLEAFATYPEIELSSIENRKFIHGERVQCNDPEIKKAVPQKVDVLNRLKKCNFITTSGTAVKTEAFKEIGMFPKHPQLRIGEDYLAWLLLASRNPVGINEAPLILSRTHGGNITKNKMPLITGLQRVACHLRENGRTEIANYVMAQTLKTLAILICAFKPKTSFSLLLQSLRYARYRENILTTLGFPALYFIAKYKNKGQLLPDEIYIEEIRNEKPVSRVYL